MLFVFLFFRLIKGGRIEPIFDYGLLNFFQNLNRGTSDRWCILPILTRRPLSLQLMDSQSASELGLEPGSLGRHDVACIGYPDELLH